MHCVGLSKHVTPIGFITTAKVNKLYGFADNYHGNFGPELSPF
jgi:hypothetical protein